jgi:hypothetical protein
MPSSIIAKTFKYPTDKFTETSGSIVVVGIGEEGGGVVEGIKGFMQPLTSASDAAINSIYIVLILSSSHLLLS